MTAAASVIAVALGWSGSLGFMAVSQSFLDSLPPDLKALTVAGIRQMATVQREFNKGAEGRQNAAFIEGGGEIYVPTEEEMETFRAVKDPMRDWYVEQFGRDAPS